MVEQPYSILAGMRYVCTPRWRQATGVVDDFHRLYFPLAGQAVIERGPEVVTLQPRRVYLIPGGRPIRFHCPHRMELYWMHFRSHTLEDDAILAGLDRACTWPAADWSYWKPTAARIAELVSRQPAELVVQTQAMLQYLVGPLVTQQRRTLQSSAVWELVERLRPVLRYMDEAFRDEPSLAQVARVVHLSPAHFHRVFARCFALSPHGYMLRKRMLLAARLLRRGDLPVAEVGRQCGYDNPYYFSRTFRRYYGQTARAVRGGAPLARP